MNFNFHIAGVRALNSQVSKRKFRYDVGTIISSVIVLAQSFQLILYSFRAISIGNRETHLNFLQEVFSIDANICLRDSEITRIQFANN